MLNEVKHLPLYKKAQPCHCEPEFERSEKLVERPCISIYIKAKPCHCEFKFVILSVAEGPEFERS